MGRYISTEPRSDDIQPLAFFSNRKLPWERPSLSQEIAGLACQPPSETVPDPAALLATPLRHIHPCSWFAVWWQPLYRIPDMPLDAKFLAYYSFSSIHAWASDPRCTYLQLPISGLICGSVSVPQPSGAPTAPDDERWLSPYPMKLPSPGGAEPAAAARKAQRAALDDVQALHGQAQCMTCNWPLQVEVLNADGSVRDGDAHTDFAFLQRGRLSASS